MNYFRWRQSRLDIRRKKQLDTANRIYKAVGNDDFIDVRYITEDSDSRKILDIL